MMNLRHRRASAALVCALALAGCRKEAPPSDGERQLAEAAASPPAPAASPSATSPTCNLPQVASRLPAAARVVAVGDLHGDLAAARAVLSAAKLIDSAGRWSGGEAVLVQTGDLLDRGDDEQALIDWLEQLAEEAALAGGRVIVLNGNHELMNAAGDLRYVTAAGMADFADAPGVDVGDRRFASAPETVRARLAAFAPGGAYASILARHNTAVVVGDSLFVHGGLEERWGTYGLARLNRDIRCWLAGVGAPPEAAVDPSGPVWSRSFSAGDIDCTALKRALEAAGAARMVVGHTPQAQGVTSACNGNVWRIDVGLGRAYGGPIQALELRGTNASIIQGTR